MVIAKVYDEYLYESDIREILPDYYTKEDSIAIVENYIKQWCNKAVILNKAKKNIEAADYDKKLNEYKNSLIIYEYERTLVDQLLDTIVSEKEVQEYYEAYPDNFILKDNILRIIYVKLHIDSKSVDRLKKIIFKTNITEEDIVELQKMVNHSAINYSLDADKWIPFNELQREIPIETYNEKLFLQNNKNITLEDNDFIYLARVLDYKIKESISPLNFEEEKIKEIILNKRKVEILNNMHTQLHRDAELNNEIIIYTNE
ncbi:hypothetical protein LJC16_01495 [Bacteroidales bacterium OttesenSCG-928-C19]|nr:hypothetical protein [Bacteroidales bacterium OttesenSCG-928-C19]